MASNTNGLSVDQLAANLEKCAALVKQNNKGDPLLRQTIHDLTYFITGKRVSPRSTKATVSSKHVSPAGSITSTLGKMVGGLAVTSSLTGSSSDPPGSSSSDANAAATATSAKNAPRAKADLPQASSSTKQSQKKKSSNGHGNWCDEHLTRNCSCQTAKQQQPQATTTRRNRPEFRRPTNPKSSLVANGWIEQQRRSKMRTVWKQVIMSLVEGKEGHGPALWIQREIIPEQQPGSKAKKPELEALHQIPAAWILDVTYSKYSTDNQFKLNVKNMAEEFVFRCPESAEAAQDWVATIRSIMVGKETANTSLDDWDETLEERKPASRDDTIPAVSQPKPAPPVTAPEPPPPPPPPSTAIPPQVPVHQEQPPPRMSIKELRAIAHGAGITTHGMERGELERLVRDLYHQHHHRTVTPEIPSVPSASSADGSAGRPWDEQGAAAASKAEQDLLREKEKQKAEREEAEKQRAAEAQRRREIEEQTKRAEEQRRQEEEERRRLEAERRRREEEEHQKRVTEMQAAEQRRREEEQRRIQQQQWAQQQQEWRKKQEEEMQKRQAEELRQAEERRRQEEAFRQQQQWHHHQQQQQAAAAQHHAWQQQQQQQTPFGPHYGHVPPPQHQPQAPPAGSSPVNMKYAKMATQVSDGRLQHIKHSVLVEWALQPPTMQILRSIEILITSIHTVFPPKYGVAPHPHFGKWAVVPMAEVVTGTQPDNEKLKKAVRKLRFFLHPDKLPREFSEEQSFVCKMLWDITSDAYEEYKKREEELGWMRG